MADEQELIIRVKPLYVGDDVFVLIPARHWENSKIAKGIARAVEATLANQEDEADDGESRPEWITCIRGKTDSSSLCGREETEFRFQSAEHARLNAEQEGRLELCSDCEKLASQEDTDANGM